MPDTIYSDISKAFAKKLDLINVGRVEAVAIGYENDTFEPIAGTVWIDQQDIPAQKMAAGLGTNDSDEYDGIYQVNVYFPKGDIDAKFEAMELADDIENHMKRGTSVTYNGESARVWRTNRLTIGQAAVSGSTINTAWAQIVIEFYYLAYKS